MDPGNSATAGDSIGGAIPDGLLVEQVQGLQSHVAASLKLASRVVATTGRAWPHTPPAMPEVDLPDSVHEPPSTQDIEDYARYLGMDLETDADLLYIAEWALTAPVPQGWTVHIAPGGQEFFHHSETNATSYQHPLDQQYREMYNKKKQEKLRNQPK